MPRHYRITLGTPSFFMLPLSFQVNEKAASLSANGFP